MAVALDMGESLCLAPYPDSRRPQTIQERLGKLGLQGADMTREQLGAFQKAEVAKWAAVIKSANIKLE